MFAAKHWVEDTHALRMLDTKLGASFTIALVFIVSCICAFVADPINNFVKTSGLEPGTDELLKQVKNYSKITIAIQTFAPQPDAQCDTIQNEAPGDGLTCITTQNKMKIYQDVGTECVFEYECLIGTSIRGTQDFVLELPEAFQYVKWSVTSSFWSPDISKSRFGNVLATNASLNEQPLAGTKKDPITLQFGAIRSSPEDDFKMVKVNALQLFWRGTKKRMGAIESTSSSSSYSHYVAFQLQVEENIYRSKLSYKLNPSSMFSVLVAYALTALSVLGTGKMFCQKGIDALMRRRARKTNEKVPSDVLRRERILDEHLLTRAGSRRMSMSGGDDDGGGGGGGKPQKQRRLSTRELMKLKKSTPKKQRRLSSRELMKEAKDKATAVNIQIEMTEFELGDGNDAMKLYSNPLKRHPVGSGESKTHLPTSLSTVGQAAAGSDGAGGDEDGMKEKMQRMEKKFEKKLEEQRREQSRRMEQTKQQMQEKLEEQRREQSRQMEQMKQQIQMLLAVAPQNDDGDGEGGTTPGEQSESKQTGKKRKSFRRVVGDNSEEGTQDYFVNMETGESVWYVPDDGDLCENNVE